MIKKTLYFGNPVYLSLKNAQLVIKLPEVVKNDTLPESFKRMSEVTKPIEDIGVIVLDHKQITITSGVFDWQRFVETLDVQHITLKLLLNYNWNGLTEYRR